MCMIFGAPDTVFPYGADSFMRAASFTLVPLLNGGFSIWSNRLFRRRWSGGEGH